MPSGVIICLIAFYIVCALMIVSCIAFEVLLVLSIIGMVKANKAANTDPDTYLPIAKKKKRNLIISIIGIGASLLIVFIAFAIYMVVLLGMAA